MRGSDNGHNDAAWNAARSAARAAERLQGSLGAREVVRSLPVGWSVAARRVLRRMDGLLWRANAAEEARLVAVARDFAGDGEFRGLARGVRGLMRLERAWSWLRARGRSLERKAEVLRERREDLLEALGGEAALARWDAAWGAEGESEGGSDGKGGAADRGVVHHSGGVPDWYREMRARERAEARAKVQAKRVKEKSAPDAAVLRRQTLRAELRAEFRLAGRPRRRVEGEAAGQRIPARTGTGRGAGHGSRRVRIPVWPEELRGEVGEQRRGRKRGGQKRRRQQGWTRGDVAAVDRSFRDGVAAKCRGP